MRLSILKSPNTKLWRKYFLRYRIPVFILTLIIMSSGFLIFSYKIPFRLPDSDVFQQMTAIKNFGNPNQVTHDAYFGTGPVDLHSGPYYFSLYLLSTVANLSLYTIILISATLNILFLCVSLYFFASSFALNTRQRWFFILISLFGWGVLPFWAGLFDYTNLLVTGSFSATIGLCFILICLGLGRRILISESRAISFVLILLASSVLLSHLLSGVILMALLFLLLFEDIVRHRSISLNAKRLLVSIAISLCLTLFIWPLFGLLTLFSSTKTVKLGGAASQNLFALSLWPQLLGAGFLGFAFLPYLIKVKQYFIALLIIFTSIVTISYLFPVRISLYWRFFPYVFLAISFALASYLGQQRKRFSIFIVSIIVLIGIVRVDHRIQDLTLRPITSDKELFELISKIPNNSIVFSDPNTSYRIAALYPVKVVVVPYTHANPSNFATTKKRYDDAIKLLKSKPSETEQSKFFKEYNVQYVLVNSNPYHDGLELNNSDWLAAFRVIVPHKLVAKKDNSYVYKVEGSD